MIIPMPAEFEAFACEQVKAGAVRVLRECASRITALRATIEEGKTDITAGRSDDGRAVMPGLTDRANPRPIR